MNLRDLARRGHCSDRPDESGVALIIVVGIAFLLIIASTTAYAIADSSLRQGTNHVEFERALHLAEEGVDQALAILQHDETGPGVTVAATPSAADLATPQAEEAWARAQLAAAAVHQTDRGEYAVIRPTGRQTVYAGAWVPSRTASQRSRVLKADYIFSTFAGPYAVLTGSDIEIGGSSAIGGNLGNVHTNGDAKLTGNSATVVGSYTSTGGFAYNAGSTAGQVGPGSGPGSPMQVIPPVVPQDIHALNSAANADNWYDLCPDGTARRPGSTPCTGTVLYVPADAPRFRGWSYSNPGPGVVWKNTGDAYDGVYYVKWGSADISGNASNWRTTIITEPQPAAGCNSLRGDIEMTGSPTMKAYLGSLLLISGRDLKLQGTPGAQFGSATAPALLEAHEQIYLSGNAAINGAVIAEDACHTPGSPVGPGNYVSGSLSIVYNDQLDLNVGQLIRTTLWLEL